MKIDMHGYIELFLNDIEVVKETFNRYNIPEVVKAINSDVKTLRIYNYKSP